MKTPIMKYLSASLPLIAAAMFSVACTQRAVSPADTPTIPVSFASDVEQTKTPLTGTSMKGQSFSLLRGTDGTSNINLVTPAPQYIQATCDANTGAVTTDIFQYLSKGTKLQANYVGYYPQQAGSVVNGNYVITYVMSGLPSTQKDIMVATSAKATSANPKCALTFTHLCTMLELHLKMEDASIAAAYGQFRRATIVADVKTDLIIAPDGTATLARNGGGIASYYFTEYSYVAIDIPTDQFLEIGQVTFSPASMTTSKQIYLEFRNKAGAYYDITGLPANLEAGKKYIINATATKGGIKFDISATDWVTDSSDNNLQM